MAKPISPNDVAEQKLKDIPDAVIEVFNRLIAENYSNGRSVVNQEDLVKGIAAACNCSRQHVFDKHWLDVEDIYRKSGWHVVYDKPAYCESYEPTFTFKKYSRSMSRIDE